MIKFYCYTVLFYLLIYATCPAMAASVGSIVAEGNEAYNQGKFDEALSAYEKALKETPESGQVFFNLGAAYYQKGEYEKAIEAFEKAALMSKYAGFEANSKFNLGNSRFRKAEKMKINDLHSALELYRNSIQNYREALELSPDFIEAAENMEIARLEMKSVLDQIEKQEEISQKNNQNRRETAGQIQKLIEKQKQLKDMTEDVRDQKARSEKIQNTERRMESLAADQQKLSEETKTLFDKVPSLQSDPSSAENPPKKHLSQALEQQDMASENLAKKQVEKALENQEKSIDELKNALDSLNDNHEKDQQKKQQNPDGQGSDIGTAANQETQEQEEENRQEVSEQEKNISDEKDATAILEEEKENIKNRRRESAVGYKEVDRDW